MYLALRAASQCKTAVLPFWEPNFGRFRIPASAGKRKRPGAFASGLFLLFGGDGGICTPVRQSSTRGSTCLAVSIGLVRHGPRGRPFGTSSIKFNRSATSEASGRACKTAPSSPSYRHLGSEVSGLKPLVRKFRRLRLFKCITGIYEIAIPSRHAPIAL